MFAHGPQHALRVGAFHVEASRRQPPLEFREFGRRQSPIGRDLEHARVDALRVEQLLGNPGERARRRRRDDPGPLGGGERCADVDHRVRHRHVPVLGRTVRHRDFVVVFEDAVTILREDVADAFHAEHGELRGPQRAHARAAVDVDALRQGPEDLLVPDGRHAVEVAVDDPDRPRFQARHAVDVPLRDGRQVDRVQMQPRLARVEGRAREHVDRGARTQPRLVAARPARRRARHADTPAGRRCPRGRE